MEPDRHIERELRTARGFASCVGDDDRLDQAEQELAELRAELERLRGEVEGADSLHEAEKIMHAKTRSERDAIRAAIERDTSLFQQACNELSAALGWPRGISHGPLSWVELLRVAAQDIRLLQQALDAIDRRHREQSYPMPDYLCAVVAELRERLDKAKETT